MKNKISDKIRVLTDANSPLFRKEKIKVTTSSVHYFGFEYLLLRKWARGEASPDASQMKVLLGKIRQNFNVEIELSDFDESVSVLEFLDRLILDGDAGVGFAFPTTGNPLSDYMMEEKDGHKLLEEISGVYALWRPELSRKTKGVASKASICISHLEFVGGACVVKCYMEVPAFSGTGSFAYEGCVCRKGDTIYFIFTEDMSAYPDQVIVLANRNIYSLDERISLQGIYSTVNQDTPPKPVSVPVFLRWISPSPKISNVRENLKSHVYLINNSEEIESEIKEIIFAS